MSAKIGSRASQTTVYWVNTDIQVVCGCFKGNWDQFKKAVATKYLDEAHDYHKFIRKVENYRK